MNDNKELTTYLDEYLKMDKPQFAVMISGKWGCGKTYYIEKRIEEWAKKKERTDSESVVLKPIYVSVNGLNSVSTVVRKIKTALHPILYSKGAKVAKKIAFGVMSIAVKSNIDIDGDGTGEELGNLLDAEGILEIFMSDSAAVKGNKVLVLDDIERSKIPLDELFGFVNGIVEHSNSKVILVCDENKLIEVAKKENLAVEYKDFKEKLVGQTFLLEADYAGITREFIDASGNILLRNNRNLITELFIASKCENLRLLRHCLIDIRRFFEQLPKSIEDNPNYDSFVTNVVAYLTIASLEDRFGNNYIEYYQSFSLSEEDKKLVHEVRVKYNGLLESHGLYNSVYTIPFKYLVAFVRTGFLISPDYLVSECRMLRSRNLSNWEKLWNCSQLSNDEFINLLETEKRRFYNKELGYAFEVVHLAGILLSLERRGLVKLSRKNVIRTAKSNIKAISEKYPDDTVRNHLNSQGYEFHEHNTDEMREIVSYLGELNHKRIKKQETDYIATVWESMDDNMTYGWLYDKFEQSTPTRRCAYSMEAIFVQVSPTFMANKLACLSNGAKMEFCHFLVERYYLKGSSCLGEIRQEIKQDKAPLEKIANLLKSKAKRQKLIDKENTIRIANRIDEAIGKM